MSRQFVAGICVGILITLALLCAILVPLAHADPSGTIDQPDLNGVICNQIALGQTPGEIADELHRGDGRISIWEGGRRVWCTGGRVRRRSGGV